jgi:hypothetical protein
MPLMLIKAIFSKTVHDLDVIIDDESGCALADLIDTRWQLGFGDCQMRGRHTEQAEAADGLGDTTLP